jgi:hypothetical protein
MIRSFIAALLLVAAFPGWAQTFGGNPSGSVPSTGGTFTGAIVAPSFDPPAQDFLFYANPATGSDANTCTSSAAPCATFAAAVAKLPQTWKQKNRINLACGAYTTGNLNVQAGVPRPGGEPLVIQGAMEDSGLGELTVTAVGATSAGNVYQLTAAVTPTLDQYRGYFLRMTSCAVGANCVGLTRIVRANTTGGLFEMNSPDPGSSYRPAIGDKFVIERSCSVITYSSGYLRFNGSQTPGTDGSGEISMVLHQLRFERGTGGTIFFNSGNTWVTSVAINLGATATSVIVSPGAKLIAGLFVNNGYSTPMSDIIADPAARYFGSGLVTSSSNAASVLAVEENSELRGFVVATGHPIETYGNSTMKLNSPSIKTGWLRVDGKSLLTIDSTYSLGGTISGSTSAGLWVRRNGFAYITNIGLDSSSNTGDGILVDSGGDLTVQGKVTGTGNGGAGVSVQNAGIYLEQGAGSTITGTGGEIKVGSQTTTHAAVYGGTPLVDVLGGIANNAATAATALTLPAVTSTSYTASVASGSNAFGVSVNGARVDFGAGASDYASSDGTTVTFAGPLAASNLSGTNSGNLTLTAVGSTPSANGASLSTQALTLQPADATHPGLVTTGTQSFAGEKTFASIVTSAASGQVALSGTTGSLFCPGGTTRGCFASTVGPKITTSATLSPAYLTSKVISAIDDPAENAIQWGAKTTLDTCNSFAEGTTERQGGVASSGIPTKLCFCQSDGAVEPTYAWKNVTGVFAIDAAAIGNDTTCP